MFLFFPIIVGALLVSCLSILIVVKSISWRYRFFIFRSIMAFLVFYILDSENTIISDSFISRPFLTVLMLLYPLVDTLRAFTVRSFKGMSPFIADRIHLHHRLADKGYEHWQASLLIFFLSVLILVINCFLFMFLGLNLSIVLTVFLLIILYYSLFK